MSIAWNKVTWYSKLIAVVVFVATFYIAFKLGTQYQAVLDQPLVLPPLPIQSIHSTTTSASRAAH